MINFENVNSLFIPEGEVRQIFRGKDVLWQKLIATDVLALATNNYWISTAGKKSGNDTNWISTDYIPVSDSAYFDYWLYYHASVGSICCYDKDWKVVGYAQRNGTYHVPKGTAYITITGATEKMTSTATKQYVTMYDLPQLTAFNYVKEGLILWCDGIDNTGSGHDATVTTWADLSGNGNDIINVSAKDNTSPVRTLQGVWESNGITIDAEYNQFLRTIKSFDLGADRTLEMRVTPIGNTYATIGFTIGERAKFRTGGGNWWVRLTASDTDGAININANMPTVYNEPITVSITRKYNADTDSTLYVLYVNGTSVNTRTVTGNYREGESDFLFFGSEKPHMTVHSVRLYDRALNNADIAYNYMYDKEHFT